MSTLCNPFGRHAVRHLIVAGTFALGFVVATSGAQTARLATGGVQGPGPLHVTTPASRVAGIHTQSGHSRLAVGGVQGPGPLFVP